MKYLNKILFLATFITLVVAGCKKVADLPFYKDGNVVALTASKTTLTPVPGDSTKDVVTFSWTDPNYATDSKTVRYLLEIDSAGSQFGTKVTKELAGERTASIKGSELNNILLNYGFTPGTSYELEVRVVSSYANNNEQFKSNTVKLTVTPYTDPSVFSTSKIFVAGSLVTATDNALTFSWTPSFKGYSGVVTYSIQYDSLTKNFANAQNIPVGPTIYNLPMTIGQINGNALDVGIKGTTSGKVQYRLKAVTALGAVAYSNPVNVTVKAYVSIINMYLVGAVNGWDINVPLQLISDKGPGRNNKVYYTYVKLDANSEFKFVQKIGDWGSAYGNTGTSGTGYTTDYNQGGNFSSTTAGVYRLTIDISNKMVYVQQKQVGIVGNMQGWTPATPIFGAYVSRDKFLIVANSNGTDEFKFHEGPVWDNGTPDKTRWWGIGTVPGTLDNDGQGANLVANTSPRTRAIWDGSDPEQVKYELSPASEMRLVGDGMNKAGVNDWDPPSSPQMTYFGNGVWKITIALKAGKDIKFLAGNAWGALDYEDNGAGVGTGTRNIQLTGADNFKTPAAAGTYTITLDEHHQTMSIN